MKIYLDTRLLIQSKIFPENKKIFGENLDEESERDWNVYTFNSKGRLACLVKYNPAYFKQEENLSACYRLVSVKLHSYDKDKFLELQNNSSFEELESMNLPFPDHKIGISGYHSGICTSLSTIKKLAKVLEESGIDCLVNNNAGPLCNHIFYESPNLEKQKANPIEVELG
jgi:hypothetical protein